MKPRFRGYVFSRPFMGERVPQAVQNLVIRDYCARKGFDFLLSFTEYAMPSCHLILEQSIETILDIDGIVMYSIFQLPENKDYRREVYHRVIDQNKTIHFACEGISLSDEDDFGAMETLWMIKQTMPLCPTVLKLSNL